MTCFIDGEKSVLLGAFLLVSVYKRPQREKWKAWWNSSLLATAQSDSSVCRSNRWPWSWVARKLVIKYFNSDWFGNLRFIKSRVKSFVIQMATCPISPLYFSIGKYLIALRPGYRLGIVLRTDSGFCVRRVVNANDWHCLTISRTSTTVSGRESWGIPCVNTDLDLRCCGAVWAAGIVSLCVVPCVHVVCAFTFVAFRTSHTQNKMHQALYIKAEIFNFPHIFDPWGDETSSTKTGPISVQWVVLLLFTIRKTGKFISEHVLVINAQLSQLEMRYLKESSQLNKLNWHLIMKRPC